MPIRQRLSRRVGSCFEAGSSPRLIRPTSFIREKLTAP